MSFTRKWEDIELTVGKKGNTVQFRKPPGYEWNQIRIAHTHPEKCGGTLSMDDALFLTDSGSISITAVYNEGTYTLEKTSKSKAKSFMRAYDLEYKDCVRRTAGLPNRKTEVRKLMHAWLSSSSQKHGFKYSFEKVE